MSSSIKSYFERKKRDLSDKSNNEEERKKARESTLDLSLSKETSDDTDVFAEGIEPPRFASILYDCLKKLELKVNEIYELSSYTKDAQIKGAEQLEDVSESIKFINEKFEEDEADIVKNDLGEETTIHDIDRIHRLGKRKLDNNVSRPIIVKFTRYNVRNRILNLKRNLKEKL